MSLYSEALKFKPLILERPRNDMTYADDFSRYETDIDDPADPRLDTDDSIDELDILSAEATPGKKKSTREDIISLMKKPARGRVFAYPPVTDAIEPIHRRLPPQRKTWEQLVEQHGVETTRKMLQTRMDAFAVVMLPHHTQGPLSKMHRYMYQNYSQKMHTGAREALIAPRGSAKSTGNTLVFPLFAVCYGEYHHMIIASDTADQAEDYLSDIKTELETNEAIDMLFPEVHGAGKVWRMDRIITKNDMFLRAIGSGGRVRGRRYGSYRPDCIILDDVENKQMIESETLRKGLLTWFDQDLVKVGSRAQDVDIFVVGTIIHQEALLNQLMTAPKYASWHVRKFQSIERWSRATPLWQHWKRIYNDRHNLLREQEAMRFFCQYQDEMLVGTQIMWENWDSYYRLMEEVAKDGELAFYKEKQNIPINPSDQTFKRDKINFYQEEEWNEKIDPAQCVWVGYLDSALGKKKTKNGDNYAVTIMAKHIPTGYAYVRYFHRKRAAISVQIDELVNLLQQYPYLKKLGIESNTFQVMIKDKLQEKLLERGITCKLVEVYHGTDKTSRIEGLEPFISNGTIRLKDDGSHEDLLLEMDWFPVGKDDGLDSLESCFSLISQNIFRMQFAQARQCEAVVQTKNGPVRMMNHGRGCESNLVDVGGVTKNVSYTLNSASRITTKTRCRSLV